MPRYIKWVPNGICDICGFRHPLTELRKNWKGQMVCREDYEPRNVQEFVRGIPDRQGVRPDMRPRPADVYVSGFDPILDSSGQAITDTPSESAILGT